MARDIRRTVRGWALFACVSCLLLTEARPVRAQQSTTHILPLAALASRYFGNDAPWYAANIPFFDCSDPQINQIYYYRWKLYKSHLKDLGERGYIVTEFLGDVGWAMKPYQSLVDATAFHIHEGRWLRDSRYVDDYIDFMYHGGNNRGFSESIAAAAYDDYLVTGDRAFAVSNLVEMKRLFELWHDHYDAVRGLYYIQPLADATEFSIASIDATNEQDGFEGGPSFRPSINSFMYANAAAIGNLSALAGDADAARTYAARAAALRTATLKSLWNDASQHFMDRYKVSNRYVHSWDFVRGRELVGYTPWYYDLPDKDPKYNAAWRHLLSPDELGGPDGIRTVEPSYPYYLKQYRYAVEDGVRKPECQWNGPSWPFQTTLALGGMANLLNNYSQDVVHADDYVRLLKQYTRQHFLDGQPDLQEDYDPDTGKVIVGLARSHHYNHSCYDDLIITGLVGLRPRADNVLEVHPLIPADLHSPNTLTYFCLENVPYHGQAVTILYDRDGRHYGRGVGLSVYVNGRRVVAPSALGRKTVAIARPMGTGARHSRNLAVSLSRQGYPVPSASCNTVPGDLYQAIDGRVWYYPSIRNYWTNAGSKSARDWYSLDFGGVQTVTAVKLYFYSDGAQFQPPPRCTLQCWKGTAWADVPSVRPSPTAPLGNGETTLTFPRLETAQLRVVFQNPKGAAVALVEMKAISDTRTQALATAGSPSPATVSLLRGKVGVGAWQTGAEFKDVEVTQDGRTLYKNDFTGGLADWTLGAGQWTTADGALHPSVVGSDERATAGDVGWTDYTYHLKARKMSGAEGFLILFRVQDDADFVWWNVGGWGNTRSALEQSVGGERSELGASAAVTVDTGRWYDVRIECWGRQRPVGSCCRKAAKKRRLPDTCCPLYALAREGQFWESKSVRLPGLPGQTDGESRLPGPESGRPHYSGYDSQVCSAALVR